MVNVGEEALVFYNDKASFNAFVKMMKAERNVAAADRSGSLRYHIELVRLLSLCTMGKNVYTEIKCHSLLTLDDIVAMVSHRDCLPELKDAYIDFLNQAYIDTEVEVKEIYSTGHMWRLFERSFIADITSCSSDDHSDRKHADTALEHYVTVAVVNLVTAFFRSPFSDQSTTVQTRQSVIVQLLKTTFQLSQCAWLSSVQKTNVQTCIRTLSDTARTRNIAIPIDLENQVASLFSKPSRTSITKLLSRSGSSNVVVRQQWQSLTRDASSMQLLNSDGMVRSDRSIVEKLQDIVVLLESHLQPLVKAESSIIVEVLYRPEFLFPAGVEARRKCSDGKLIRRLIVHAEHLLEDKDEKLCIRLLGTLRQMMNFDTRFGDKGDSLRKNLLIRYLHSTGNDSLRTNLTLEKVQEHLDKKGASELVVDLIIKFSQSVNVFMEAVHLGIALLEGGNSVIQRSLLTKLQSSESSCVFFKVFYETMGVAQLEIKSTFSNTAEMESSAINKIRSDHPELAGKDESSSTGVHFKLSPKVVIMLPVLRFLQLLCENHNFELQVTHRSLHFKN